ncbi:MAG: hypothetical protein ACLRMZ_04865 [Blautia marasmi]
MPPDFETRQKLLSECRGIDSGFFCSLDIIGRIFVLFPFYNSNKCGKINNRAYTGPKRSVNIIIKEAEHEERKCAGI